MGRLKRHLSFANIVACLALFIALGGASYAALKLPKGSVGTRQLKNGAVTAGKVKDGSLLAKDFKPGQLPAGAGGPRGAVGPQGATGPQGPAGPQGPPGTAAEVSTAKLPHARIARLSSSQLVTSGGAQHVLFDSVVEDTAGMADLTTRPGALRAPRSGLYLVAGELLWHGVKGEGRMGGTIVGVKSDGSESLKFRAVRNFEVVSPVNYLAQPMSEVIRLNEGQYVEMVAFQQTGQTNELDGEDGSWLEATYLGP